MLLLFLNYENNCGSILNYLIIYFFWVARGMSYLFSLRLVTTRSHYPRHPPLLSAHPSLYNLLALSCGLTAENTHRSFLFHAHADLPTATLLAAPKVSLRAPPRRS